MEEYVKRIDSSLNYVKTLYPNSALVLQVEKEGLMYVLKFPRWGRPKYVENHLKQEVDNLNLAKNVQGITHLIKKYKDRRDYKNIILKEFFEGEPVYSVGKINDSKLQIKLRNTIDELHSLGIAKLDIDNQNIVISPDRQDVFLVDLGSGILEKNMSLSEFRKLKKGDIKDLEENIFL